MGIRAHDIEMLLYAGEKITSIHSKSISQESKRRWMGASDYFHVLVPIVIFTQFMMEQTLIKVKFKTMSPEEMI